MGPKTRVFEGKTWDFRWFDKSEKEAKVVADGFRNSKTNSRILPEAGGWSVYTTPKAKMGRKAISKKPKRMPCKGTEDKPHIIRKVNNSIGTIVLKCYADKYLNLKTYEDDWRAIYHVSIIPSGRYYHLNKVDTKFYKNKKSAEKKFMEWTKHINNQEKMFKDIDKRVKAKQKESKKE